GIRFNEPGARSSHFGTAPTTARAHVIGKPWQALQPVWRTRRSAGPLYPGDPRAVGYRACYPPMRLDTAAPALRRGAEANYRLGAGMRPTPRRHPGKTIAGP